LENVAEAKRLADKAVLLEPNLPAAYQTLGVAHRLDFQFEESVSAYTKALELDAELDNFKAQFGGNETRHRKTRGSRRALS
jgi:tetratricopeptide (TPR) repeat protein